MAEEQRKLKIVFVFHEKADIASSLKFVAKSCDRPGRSSFLNE